MLTTKGYGNESNTFDVPWRYRGLLNYDKRVFD